MVAHPDKPLVWLHGEVKSPPFSSDARIELGCLLRRLQRGDSLPMPHSRPMPEIGRRCHELRNVDGEHTWRIIYRVDRDAIVIAEVVQQEDAQDPAARHRAVQTATTRLRRGSRSMEEMMKRQKKARLEAAGWKVGSAREFLGLTDAEAAVIELKLEFAKALREQRARRKMTQEQAGQMLGSSQSRVAKMEAGDPSVSIDLLLRSLFRLGGSRQDLVRHLAAPTRRRAA